MGYACPVCGAPQADAGHLANHLAFTATLGDDDHASWLDDTVPGWDEASPAELADRVTDHATETEYPRVFEDTTGEDIDHPGSASGIPKTTDDPADPADPAGAFPGDADVDAEDVLVEARELTRQRRENAAADGSDVDSSGTAAVGDDGDDPEPGENGDRGGNAGPDDAKNGDPERGDREDGEPDDPADEDASGAD